MSTYKHSRRGQRDTTSATTPRANPGLAEASMRLGDVRYVRITNRTATEKRSLWERIQSAKPALARMLRESKKIAAVVKAFDADIYVEI